MFVCWQVMLKHSQVHHHLDVGKLPGWVFVSIIFCSQISHISEKISTRKQVILIFWTDSLKVVALNMHAFLCHSAVSNQGHLIRPYRNANLFGQVDPSRAVAHGKSIVWPSCPTENTNKWTKALLVQKACSAHSSPWLTLIPVMSQRQVGQRFDVSHHHLNQKDLFFFLL